jgi:glycosyltransferase involved in cell wall biosynthesis
MNKKNFRIALIAPPFGATGGPEIATLNLAEALYDEGIDVTLFAPGDWKTRVKHIETIPKSIWNMGKNEKGDIRALRMESEMAIMKYLKDFDLIHFNVQKYSPDVARLTEKPTVLTMHNNFSDLDLEKAKSAGMHVVALSQSQAKGRKVDAIIFHGLSMKNIVPSFVSGEHLVFVGRLTQQKGVETAIEIAKKSGNILYIIGRAGNTIERKKYFEEKIAPSIDGKRIIYLGTIDHDKIFDYCAKAKALLFPILRSESFGLVAIEALACGTPVIGTSVDPLPEILNDKKVAFLSNNINDLVLAVNNVNQFVREDCRKFAQTNFDSHVMARKYIALYNDILKKS